MLKRSAAWMLALMMLVYVLPVNSIAVEYEVGDIIYLPAGEVPGVGWEPVPGEDGMQESEEVECAHDYHAFCLEYAWKYKGGVKQGTPTDMTVLNVDTKGNPLVGTEFMLYEEVDGSLIFVADAKTDENGVATFEDLCLTEERDTAQWVLTEKNFMENPLSEIYRPNGGKWAVTISRDAYGAHSIDVNGDTAFVSAQDAGTDAVVVNEEYTATAAIDLKIEIDDLSKLTEKKIKVTIEKLPEAEQSAQDTAEKAPAEEDAVKDEPFEPREVTFEISDIAILQDRFEQLPLGTYIVTLDTESAQLDGYTLVTTYETNFPSVPDEETSEEQTTEETPEESQPEEEVQDEKNGATLAFDTSCTHTTVTITNTYTSIPVEEEPTEEEKQDTTITIVARDELDRPVEDAEFALVGEAVSKVYLSDASGAVEVDMADFAVEGEEVTFTLKQTGIPVGYELDATVYNVTISEENGSYDVEVEKQDQGFAETVTSWFRGDRHDAHFCNHRKMARVKVYCNVQVKYHDAFEDTDFTEDCEEKKYEYTLTYRDENGKLRERTLKLSDGDSEWFKEDLPYGTEYEVTAKEGKGFSTQLDENADNTITEDDLGEVIPVRVLHTYDVYGSDEDLELDFVKVDEKSKDPLPGATFVLKDEDDSKVGTYETTKENEAEFTVKELSQIGQYTLKETEAPEGYYKLKKALVIDVFADYELERAGDGWVYVQTLDAEVSGKGVKLLSDGTYRISNSLSSGNPETGDMFNPVLWIGVLVVSGVALAALVIIGIKKKGKK